MNKINLLFMMGLFITITACSDYINSRREGLKPYHIDEKQSQEENQKDQEEKKE